LTYLVSPADVGHMLRIRLIVTADGISSEPAFSGLTGVVAQSRQPPASVSAPTVSGSAVVGALLEGEPGVWSGTEPLAYAFAWLRCDANGAACMPVAGAGFSTFLLSTDDVGRTYRLQVTAQNAVGSAVAASAPTSPVRAVEVPPTPTPTPTATPTPIAIAIPAGTPTPTTVTSTAAPVSRVVSIAMPAIEAPPPPRLAPWPAVRIAGWFSGNKTTFTIVSVRAPRRARIEMRCRGRGCPYRRRALTTRLVGFKALQRTFRAGAVIEVRITSPGVIGKYTRIKVRRNRSPARIDRCLFPGDALPRRCPT
jgi:hypothetical protein